MRKLANNYLNIPTIITKRLILNTPLETDFIILESFLKSNRSQYIGGPYTSFTSWSDYMANIGHWSLYGYGLWSIRIKDNKRFIGRVGIIKPIMFKEADFAWQLFNGYEGNGYAFEAAESIKNYTIKNLNLPSLASHILSGNNKSILLAEKLGFKYKKEVLVKKKKYFIYYHI